MAALDTDALFELSLEELIDMEVTTAARKAQPLSETAAAVFVITADDIQRLGIRSIPEALRLAPGLSVQQLDSSSWSVGSRGLSGRFANKLLVLQDGRPIYTPVFSGVEWETHTTLMEQIERIEVVRGPGAAVWGTNAVAGVINIITREADAGPERWVSAGSDLMGGQHVSAQLQRPVGHDAHLRAFAMVEDQRAMFVPGPGQTNDDWNFARTGMRLDRDAGDADVSLMVEGYRGRIGRNLAALVPRELQEPDELSGAFLVGRGTLAHDSGSETNGQFSIDYQSRTSAVFDADQLNLNLEARHQWSIGVHELVAGGLLRWSQYEVGGSVFTTLPPDEGSDAVFSVFAQDEFELIDEVLSVNLGVRLERNDRSDADIEWMPSARLLWRVAEDHSLWAAVTRAVRTPSVGESAFSAGQVREIRQPGDLRNPFPVPLNSSLNANPDLRSENLVAFELGARGSLDARIGYELTLFSMHYDDLRSALPQVAVCDPSGTPIALDPSCLLTATSVTADSVFTNLAEESIEGVELALDWQLADAWLLRGAWSLLERELDVVPPAVSTEILAPRQLASLRLDWTPSERIDASIWARYTSSSPFGLETDTWQSNAHVSWQPSDSLELSVTGRNLLYGNRAEARSELSEFVITEISRTVYLQARLTF
ncbi:MAG: TonB-dependent receptor [Pseudomonadales bacterium]|nr:TonB-dependent receptor [Pseudomonadales bacterium]